MGVKGILSFTDEFPNRPPSIIMTTESGRFAVNSFLCVSQLSDLHADEWSPSCTIAALLQTLFVFWLDDQSAHIGKVESTHERKRALAAASLEANLRFGPDARSHARACRRTRGLAIAGRGLSGIWGVGMHPTCPCAHRPRFVQKPSFRRALLERRSLTRERSHATSRALRILCATVSATRASFRHLAPTRVTRRGTLLRSHDAPAVTRPPPRLESTVAPRASRAQRMHSPNQSPLDGLWFARTFPARLAKLLAPRTRYLSCQCRKRIRSSSWRIRGLHAAARRRSTAAPALVQNCL